MSDFFSMCYPNALNGQSRDTRVCIESRVVCLCEFSPIREMVPHLCTYFGGGHPSLIEMKIIFCWSGNPIALLYRFIE